MAGGRPSSNRGSGPRSSARRTAGPSASRASSGARPGARPGGPGRRPPGRGRSGAAAEPPKPRFTGRAAILVLVLAVLMVSYASSMRAYLQQKQNMDALQQNIDSSKAAIARLERENERWGDPAYVRAVAHQRFGWVLPGEIGFQVIGEDGKPLDHQDSLTDVGATTNADRPIWWKTAWGSMVAAGNPRGPAHQPQPLTRIRAPQPQTKQ